MRENFRKFNLASDVHSYNTKNSNNIVLPGVRLEKTHKTFIFLGPTFFNLLPIPLRQLPINRFKRSIRRILIACEGYTITEIETFLKSKNANSYI
jgi:hypothetical protein